MDDIITCFTGTQRSVYEIHKLTTPKHKVHFRIRKQQNNNFSRFNNKEVLSYFKLYNRV